MLALELTEVSVRLLLYADSSVKLPSSSRFVSASSIYHMNLNNKIVLQCMMKHFLNNFLITTSTIICSHIHAVFNYETYSIWQVAITHRRNCIISNPTIDRSFTSTLMTAKQSLYIYWSYLPLSKITQSYLYCSQSDAKATKTVVSCRLLETNSAMLKIQAAYTTKNTALLTLKRKERRLPK